MTSPRPTNDGASENQREALVLSIVEVAAGARDPWEVAHLVGLAVRVVPALRARNRLVDGIVLVHSAPDGARGRLVLEGVALAALRAAGLDEGHDDVAAIATAVAQRIGWSAEPARAA